MATSCVTPMTIRAMIDSVGFEFEGEAKWYNNRFVPDEELWESSEEEEESDEEQIDESIAELVLLLERLSLIFKLWLRRINLTSDKHQRNKLQDFEHAILSAQESVIKPYKNFLMLNQYNKDLLSEPMFHFYCKSLEDECTKISIEKEKVKFEMLEEDRTRMNKDTVQACSYLGLKLDFLDRLEDMPPNIRNHRTLCDWVVIFLQNNYNSVSLTEKSSLNKELLYGIGFDPLSSAVEIILTRAGNMVEHIDACEWAERFIKDEFKYNLLFSQQNGRFPFQINTTNEWFELADEHLSHDDHDVRQVSIMNFVTKETRGMAASLPDQTRSMLRELKDEHTLLFHGTDHESAVDILSGRGIHLCSGRQKRDFSSGKGFYLTKNVNDALNWAKSTTAKPAILVFRVNDRAFRSKTRKLTLNQQDTESWREIVTSFRSGKRTTKTRQILKEYDLIEGPLATVRCETSNGELVFEPKPSSYQMCLISEDFADEFEQTLHSILFY